MSDKPDQGAEIIPVPAFTTGNIEVKVLTPEEIMQDPQLRRYVAEGRLLKAIEAWSVEEIDRLSALIERGIIRFAMDASFPVAASAPAPSPAPSRPHTFTLHPTYTGSGCAICGRPWDDPVHPAKG